MLEFLFLKIFPYFAGALFISVAIYGWVAGAKKQHDAEENQKLLAELERHRLTKEFEEYRRFQAKKRASSSKRD